MNQNINATSTFSLEQKQKRNETIDTVNNKVTCVLKTNNRRSLLSSSILSSLYTRLTSSLDFSSVYSFTANMLRPKEVKQTAPRNETFADNQSGKSFKSKRKIEIKNETPLQLRRTNNDGTKRTLEDESLYFHILSNISPLSIDSYLTDSGDDLSSTVFFDDYNFSEYEELAELNATFESLKRPLNYLKTSSPTDIILNHITSNYSKNERRRERTDSKKKETGMNAKEEMFTQNLRAAPRKEVIMLESNHPSCNKLAQQEFKGTRGSSKVTKINPIEKSRKSLKRRVNDVDDFCSLMKTDHETIKKELQTLERLSNLVDLNENKHLQITLFPPPSKKQKNMSR